MNGRARLTWCTLFCLFPVAPIAARLVYLQVIQHRKMATMAHSEATREAIEITPRGRILDRNGNVLAQSLPSWSSYLDPSVIKEPRRTATTLARILRLGASEVLHKASEHSHFVWLKRKLSPEEVQALQAAKVEGVGIVPDEQRFYPNGDMARPLLGLVGTDNNGLSGIELEYDKNLSGAVRKIPLLRDGSGHSMELTYHNDDATVPDLLLTLDRTTQHFAEEALDEGVQKYHPDKAVVVVENPKTGDILALASYPTDPLKIPAIQDAYEPGSTFKIVAMSGALEDGLAHPEETIFAENGRWEVAPKVTIRDHEPSNMLTLSGVMERSSNIGAAKIGLRLGGERFDHWARAYGFGSRTSLAFPGENPGILKDPAKITRVTLANNSFGQGVSVTPLQLVAAYSAIANGGQLLEPRLVLRAGNASIDDGPSPVRQVLSKRVLDILLSMLEGVVLRGTAVAAQIPGYRIAGKTGTAQKIDPSTGKYYADRYVGSFVGFAPVSAPRWTILVVMDNPKHQHTGADVAAPVFNKLLRNLLAVNGVKPDQPLPAPAAGSAREDKPFSGLKRSVTPKPAQTSAAVHPAARL